MVEVIGCIFAIVVVAGVSISSWFVDSEYRALKKRQAKEKEST